ncbi:hypothetical protein DL96DRAFT_1581123, partial [Flagelloscypha sp. PMI_526]
MTTDSPFSAPPTNPMSFSPGFVPEMPFPGAYGSLGQNPAAYPGLFPSRLQHFDKLGYPPFIPRVDGALKAEESRLEGWKAWLSSYQNQELQHTEFEDKLKGHILARAAAEAAFWQKSLELLELQRQISEAELTKANDRRLDELLIEKVTAEVKSAKYQADVAGPALTAKANAEKQVAEDQLNEIAALTAKAKAETEVAEDRSKEATALTEKAYAEKKVAEDQSNAIAALTKKAEAEKKVADQQSSHLTNKAEDEIALLKSQLEKTNTEKETAKKEKELVETRIKLAKKGTPPVENVEAMEET